VGPSPRNQVYDATPHRLNTHIEIPLKLTRLMSMRISHALDRHGIHPLLLDEAELRAVHHRSPGVQTWAAFLRWRWQADVDGAAVRAACRTSGLIRI
jgi:hypothetical protein